MGVGAAALSLGGRRLSPNSNAPDLSGHPRRRAASGRGSRGPGTMDGRAGAAKALTPRPVSWIPFPSGASRLRPGMTMGVGASALSLGGRRLSPNSNAPDLSGHPRRRTAPGRGSRGPGTMDGRAGAAKALTPRPVSWIPFPSGASRLRPGMTMGVGATALSLGGRRLSPNSNAPDLSGHPRRRAAPEGKGMTMGVDRRCLSRAFERGRSRGLVRVAQQKRAEPRLRPFKIIRPDRYWIFGGWPKSMAGGPSSTPGVRF
jgi:hypothetical protein